MAKRIIAWIVLILIAIAVLIGAYFFVTKGYSDKKISLPKVIQNLSTESPNPVEISQEMGNASSDKIILVVTSPKNGATLATTNITVMGKTSPEADVFVNDQKGKADINGIFSIPYVLEEGENQLIVSANDKEGNVAESDILVNVSTFQ